MFYEEGKADAALRFGDVVTGFVLGAVEFDSPGSANPEYCIQVSSGIRAVVLTPCCDIREGRLLLVPLRKINSKWLDNPHFADDLTVINRTMSPERVFSPEAWQKMPQGNRDERLAKGEGYAELPWFVYAPHDLLPRYPVKGGKAEVGHYAIDFRQVLSVGCAEVLSPTNAPGATRVLRLSIDARYDLRQKLAYFYGRPAPEDEELAPA
jgi:hypothetical protein